MVCFSMNDISCIVRLERETKQEYAKIMSIFNDVHHNITCYPLISRSRWNFPIVPFQRPFIPSKHGAVSTQRAESVFISRQKSSLQGIIANTNWTSPK